MDQNIDSSGFDQIQTPQYPEMDEEVFQAKGNLMISIQTFLEKFNCISFGENPKEYLENSSDANAPILQAEEPEYSLSMGYEHLSIIPETESDEVIESSVKNLVPNPSEYEVTSDDESECDVPIKDESSSIFMTFSNPIFDDNHDFTSSDDESLSSEEDVSIEDFKVYSNPLFYKIDPHCFNAESDLIESLSKHDTWFDSSLKFDYLEEFSCELIHFLEELLDDDYFPFIFVIRIFLLYLIYPECNLPGSGISFLLAVRAIFTGSGMFFWQWELYSWHAIFLAVASLFFWQWEPSSLAVGCSSGSGNFIAGSGNALCILFPTILP
nr:hypothetical protein [Tanacetum cinerariifolium]